RLGIARYSTKRKTAERKTGRGFSRIDRRPKGLLRTSRSVTRFARETAIAWAGHRRREFLGRVRYRTRRRLARLGGRRRPSGIYRTPAATAFNGCGRWNSGYRVGGV